MLYQSAKSRLSRAVTVCAAAVAAILAGCSGNASPFTGTPVAQGSLPGVRSSYASPVIARRDSVHQTIYVVGQDSNMLTTYTEKGAPAPLTISGLNDPVGLAVDANGKIYIANGGPGLNGSVVTYTADGQPTTPTINASISSPWGIAVDSSGKIYVANYNGGNVTTYLPDGTQTQPTISGLNYPTAVAVDGNGKIYVTQKGLSGASLTTYEADGTRTKPTITQGIDEPQSVALDADGNIYVANDGTGNITTYRPNGKQRKVTMGPFTTGSPGYMAIGETGKVYVTSSYGFVTTYTRGGKATNPTISGLGGAPLGIALH